MLIPSIVILTMVVIFIPSFFLYDEIEETDRKAEKEKKK